MLKSPVWGIFLHEGVVELSENVSSIAQASRLAKRFPRVSCLLCLDHQQKWVQGHESSLQNAAPSTLVISDLLIFILL